MTPDPLTPIDIPGELPNGPVAWVNGKYVPNSVAALPVTDLGLHGVAVTEMVRTYDHELFRLPAHLQRLEQSLALTAIPKPELDLEEICHRIARRNASFLTPSGDLGLVTFVTAGPNPTYVGAASEPTVGVHTFELPLHRWSETVQDGVRLRRSGVQPLRERSVPAAAKTRSRMHWHLATAQVRKIDESAVPVLVNENNELTETPAANVFAVLGDQVVTPAAGILPGVSRALVRELCPRIGLRWEERGVPAEELLTADEVFLSSTPYGLLPVTRFDDRQIGDGRPGPVFFELCTAWSELVGIDIIEQLMSAAS